VKRTSDLARRNGQARKLEPALAVLLSAESRRDVHSPRLSRRQRLWRRLQRHHLLFIVLTAILLALAQLGPHLTPKFGDNAEFLLLGQSLASGRGYAWVNDPVAGPHAKYPPGYPLLIAGVLLLTGTVNALPTAVPYVKALSVGLFAASLPLLYHLIHQRAGRGVATAVTLLTAVNPFMLKYATEVLSEIPYLFASLAALAILEWHFRRTAGRRRPWQALLVGAVLAVPYYVRTTGALLVPAALFWLGLQRRYREAALAGAGAVLVLLPWELRNRLLVGWTVYGGQFFGKDAANLNYEPAALSDYVQRISENVVTYFTDAFDTRFAWALPFVSIPLFALAVLGFWRALRRPTAVEPYVALYGIVCLLWPFAGGRFIVPVVPFLLCYVVLALLWLAPRLSTALGLGSSVKQPAAILAAVTLAGALPSLAIDARQSWYNLRHLRDDPATYYATQADWSSFLRAAAWLREHAEPNAVILSRKDFLMYVYGGRFSVKYRYSTEPEELELLLAAREPRYIVEDAFDFMVGEFAPLRPALEARGAGLQLVYETPGPRVVRVWRLLQPGRSGS
jgi:hypothetical protein